MSNIDVTQSKDLADTIKSFARLSLIGLQSSVQKSNLDQLAQFSYILDLNAIPSDLESILSQAYGCPS
jgi:hypothetical protein